MRALATHLACLTELERERRRRSSPLRTVARGLLGAALTVAALTGAYALESLVLDALEPP